MCRNYFVDTNDALGIQRLTVIPRTTPRLFFAIGFSSRKHAVARFPTYVCSLFSSFSFSLSASRGARMCYRDSWQHHGPAFAAWPAIVFLVSLQSTARSILPRSSTATSFAASYFTGAQHGVARYLGNFAERGCSLCQQPVPHRQRIRRSIRRSCSHGFIFLLFLIFALFSHSLSLSFFFSRRTRFLQHRSRIRANMHSRISVFTTAALPVLLRLFLLFLCTPIRFVLLVPLALLLYP